MKIDIITLFPKMFFGPFDESMVKRAQDNNIAEIKIHQLRDWGIGIHKMVDDRPFGGGPGMVLRVDVLCDAIASIKPQNKSIKSKTVLLTPQGKTFNQQNAKEYSEFDQLILICGHYEGFDERIINYIDEEISIGDYVLTGGELPAMVIVDSVVRLLPGVLNKNDTASKESFSEENSFDYPVYTQPREFDGHGVPEIYFSGNHGEIDAERKKASEEKFKKVRG
jgi:tRNA (guanine37-N1)-methyltransferase